MAPSESTSDNYDAASVFSSSTTATVSPAHPISDRTPLIPGNNIGPVASRRKSSMNTKPRHPGEDIMNSDDPSTAALRAWAREKQLQYPGQNGSFAMSAVGTGASGMGWGADHWILPQNGDKEREMDAERMRRKKATEEGTERIGGGVSSREQQQKEGVGKRRFSRFFGLGKQAEKADGENKVENSR